MNVLTVQEKLTQLRMQSHGQLVTFFKEFEICMFNERPLVRDKVTKHGKAWEQVQKNFKGICEGIEVFS